MEHSVSPLANQLGLAAFLPILLQWMKNSRLPIFSWVNQHSDHVSRLFSILFAAFATAGIAFSYNDGSLVITGLAPAVIINFAWQVMQQFSMQEVAYRAIKPTLNGSRR
jgi:hypothetical protein